jgi:hypothetical protein
VKRALLSIPLLAMCAGCSDKREAAALAFYGDAQQCLFNVREGVKYEASPNCRHLKVSSQRYISEGGQTAQEPTKIALLAEQGRTMAWMARAISASGNPSISLW